LSKSVLGSISELFQPQLPLWACEFTSHRFVVTGVDASRRRIVNRINVPIPPGILAGALLEKNFNDADGMLHLIRSAFSQAGLKGSEIGVVIPDDAARIAFLTAENLPSGQEERETFIRWKLKKSMPFDVDTAQVAYKILGSQKNPADHGHGTDLLVALSPRAVIDEYVGLMNRASLHAGFVIPSTLAALNLLHAPAQDVLFIKVAPSCISTTVFIKNRLKFYRRVPDTPIYDAVYPTVMYYQDKLMGTGIERVIVCNGEGDPGPIIEELQSKLRIPVYPLDPGNVDDTFKPALGAVDFTWVNSI